MFMHIFLAFIDWPAKSWAVLTAGLATVVVAALGLYLLARRRRFQIQPAASAPRTIMQPDPVNQVQSAEEHRQSPRPWGPPVEVFIRNNLASGAPARAWVINRSQGGVCLSLSEPLTLGTLLSVRTTNAPDSIPWSLVEVKHCEFKVNRWHVGGKFVEPVPVEVLRLFGYR